ncbi:MAG: pectic acid lyase [Planctomycetota bacterium]|nr:MAG: pectic acid lyase [Planctomycetota bacterium]
MKRRLHRGEKGAAAELLHIALGVENVRRAFRGLCPLVTVSVLSFCDRFTIGNVERRRSITRRAMATFWCLALSLATALVVRADEPDAPLPEQAASALQRAVRFYQGSVAAHGGYVYRYSADLAKREGEGKTDEDTVWVQPPGTPSVGMAYVEAYERLREPYLLDAARDAGECLIRGQMHSGGWNASIHFAEDERRRHAYRVDGKPRKSARNITSFDDDKTQSALRMLMRLDQVQEFQDGRTHEAVQYALDSILKAQFPNGGWAQVFDTIPDQASFPVEQASYPEAWTRKYPGGDYWQHYTLNDNALVDTLHALLLASRIYDESKYRNAAMRAADFLLLAQMPEPQPAWAQQYDANMHPAWARKFEPPAISGGESQNVVEALVRMYVETGERKYLDAAERAIAYLRKSELGDGRLARFYELRTNRPLYLVKDTYELTYRDDNLPTHYAFQVASRVDRLANEAERLSRLSPAELDKLRGAPAIPTPGSVKVTPELERQVREIVAALDDRGAWVEAGRLQYHGKGDDTRRVIESRSFIRNIGVLSAYLAVVRGQ